MTDRRAEDDRAASDRYRSLFENSVDAILIIEDDRFVDCNQAAVDMLGYNDRQSLLQRHPSELSPEFQPDGRRSLDKANDILAEIHLHGGRRFEWDHVKLDGSLLPVEVSMTAIPGGHGRTLHIVWRDISERRKLESELRHAQKMDAVGNLAGGIAHDFNNTLVPIVTYSDLLSRALQDRPELRRWAQEINHAGVLAASLVKKLLAVSRRNDGVPVILDLEHTVAEALGLLQKLIGEDIAVHFSGAGCVMNIETNQGDVEQILLNLAANARDALPAGGEIRLALSEINRSGQSFAQLEFADNGVGMDEVTLERIFEPFFTTKEFGGGTGLGLSSVRQLMMEARGQVRAQSSLGKGTSITLQFPLVDPGQPDSQAINNEDATPASRRLSIDGVRVLVIEDDLTISRLIRDLLCDAGYAVFTAIDGTDALRFLETMTPELVLSDVVMPGLSGPEVVQKMQEKGLHVPVIFVSGYTDDRLAAHALDPHTVSLLRKPFTADELLTQVKQALASDRGRRATDCKHDDPSRPYRPTKGE